MTENIGQLESTIIFFSEVLFDHYYCIDWSGKNQSVIHVSDNAQSRDVFIFVTRSPNMSIMAMAMDIYIYIDLAINIFIDVNKTLRSPTMI